ncbi:cell envelope integrity protein TolA [Limnohabitans sp. Rim28]|uniref:cell envelope integrity protein TolA n=1 Tax=Limnohabitans sp. Rim28 TaxID=1100720 RepID=UPI0002F0C5D9|nr:cell envelope integrity protein TolA [Limnohabitans sp. Rim28]
MNAKATPHLEFAPPEQPGMGRAWVVAGVAHALLFLALGLATAWKTQPQTLQAEAELWSAVPQAAAPRLQEPLPQPVPEPVPETRPTPPAQPTPPAPAPDPALALKDAQIALEKQKQEEKKKEAEKLKAEKLNAEKLKADQEKAIQDKAAKEKLNKAKAEKEKAEKDKAEKAKLEKEKLAKEKKAQEDKEREKKKAAEKEKAEKAEKADAARADALRQENLKRMQGMAGASGGENATGTALKSSGPSATYAGRLVGRIKPNITYPGDMVGNPRAEVEVRVAPDGVIQSRRILQSSGNKAWDEAVLRAIDKTEIFPKDTDGRVPPVIVLGFRPLD